MSTPAALPRRVPGPRPAGFDNAAASQPVPEQTPQPVQAPAAQASHRDDTVVETPEGARLRDLGSGVMQCVECGEAMRAGSPVIRVHPRVCRP
ncbi:hypothetical protein [Nocardioides yefusunii]|uniref:DksA C4-type domain-containing protein n=1 Tax=Nocardioides yefusunii TaxID=2500546 RepID=A0ABW1R118_9ACTN|nr:hypothetical protein [Nocardioides yefusunii]